MRFQSSKHDPSTTPLNEGNRKQNVSMFLYAECEEVVKESREDRRTFKYLDHVRAQLHSSNSSGSCHDSSLSHSLRPPAAQCHLSRQLQLWFSGRRLTPSSTFFMGDRPPRETGFHYPSICYRPFRISFLYTVLRRESITQGHENRFTMDEGWKLDPHLSAWCGSCFSGDDGFVCLIEGTEKFSPLDAVE